MLPISMDMQGVHIRRSLLWQAIGDALGLPYEGLSSSRGAALLGEPDRYRLLWRAGMLSDDTEHACMTAIAAHSANGDVVAFERVLASELRGWLLTCPAATGLATLRACLNLLIGVSPRASGVRSAGNGPLMRAPVLGAALSDPSTAVLFARRSARITHADPRAIDGAAVVALATQLICRSGVLDAGDLLTLAEEVVNDLNSDVLECLKGVVQVRKREASFAEHVRDFGCDNRVSGFVMHTLPVVLLAACHFPRDPERAIQEVIRCGGDTDTTAAIVGGMLGPSVQDPPERLVNGILDWPLSTRRIAALAGAFGANGPRRLNMGPWPARLGRNGVFALIVLAHGFRRLGPPYG